MMRPRRCLLFLLIRDQQFLLSACQQFQTVALTIQTSALDKVIHTFNSKKVLQKPPKLVLDCTVDNVLGVLAKTVWRL
jgi:hypothetical protein